MLILDGYEEGRLTTQPDQTTGRSFSRAPSGNFRRIYSVVSSPLEEEPVQKSKKCKRRCRICCFNFWHCQCKQENLNLGDRPMYRDDIFYHGSLESLHSYRNADRVEYHLKVTRVPNARELEDHRKRKCFTCHQAFIRTFITMTGFNLLKSKVFVFLVISSFFYTLSLYIPYVFVRKLAKESSIPDRQGVWLLSSIGISNTAGRLLSGILKNFVKMNAAMFVFACLLISGCSAFIFLIKIDIITIAIFTCFFGLFTAPFISLRPVIIVDFLGLEKLTNAFGLVLLGQGVASVIGPPVAGVIDSYLGHCVFTLYFSGILMIMASMMLLVSAIMKLRSHVK